MSARERIKALEERVARLEFHAAIDSPGSMRDVVDAIDARSAALEAKANEAEARITGAAS